MDNKRTIIGMTLALGFVAGWLMLQSYVQEKYFKNQPAAGQTAPAPATAPTTTGASPTPFVEATGVSAGMQVLDADPVSFAVTLGSDKHKDAEYALALKTAPSGAGVASVVLNQFLAEVDDPSKAPYHFQEPQD